MDTLPSGGNVCYRMDTFSSDKNVSIAGVSWEKCPESQLRIWSHLSWGSAVIERRSASNCTVCCGTAVIMMQQDSIAFGVWNNKAAGYKVTHTKKHNSLHFWRTLWLRCSLSIMTTNCMTITCLHFNSQSFRCVTDGKWRRPVEGCGSPAVRERWTPADIFFIH